MRALRSFSVRPRLPEAVRPPRTTGHEPPLVVGRADPRPVPLGRSRRLGLDPSRPAAHGRPGEAGALRGARRRPGLHPLPRRDRRRADPVHHRAPVVPGSQRHEPLRQVGYFSPEFGISEALPQYSGGLGVLAGDHLKAASDLGVPLIGVGLFYRNGYFRQSLVAGGWQQERFPTLDPYAMSVTLCDGRARHRRPRRRTPHRPGVAGRGGAHAAVPARRRHRRQRPAASARSPTGSTAATPSTASARRSCSASAGCARCRPSATTSRCSTPTRVTPASSGSSASVSGSQGGPELHRGGRGVSGGHRVHHPHARARRASTASLAS